MIKFKQVAALLIIIVFSVHANSQVSKIDSLKTLIKESVDKTQKVKLMNRLSRNYMLSNPDSGLSVGQHALKEAFELENDTLIISLYSSIGLNHLYMQNKDSAYSYFRKANLKALKLTC